MGAREANSQKRRAFQSLRWLGKKARMKSKIKSLSRTEKQVYLVFQLDDKLVKNIEKTFQKLKSGFKLSNYKKRYGGKLLDNFWELTKKDEFNFSLVVRKNIVRLKLKAHKDFIDKFLHYLERYTEFTDLSPKVKRRLEKKLK